MTEVIFIFALIVFLFWVFAVFVHRSRVVTANLISIKEISEQVPSQYYNLEYFYPLATYQYEFKGKTFTNEITSFNRFKYRQSALAFDGSKRKDTAFPWRALSANMPIDVNVRMFNPSFSYIGDWHNGRAKRELKILFILVWLVFPILLAWFYTQNL